MGSLHLDERTASHPATDEDRSPALPRQRKETVSGEVGSFTQSAREKANWQKTAFHRNLLCRDLRTKSGAEKPARRWLYRRTGACQGSVRISIERPQRRPRGRTAIIFGRT